MDHHGCVFLCPGHRRDVQAQHRNMKTSVDFFPAGRAIQTWVCGLTFIFGRKLEEGDSPGAAGQK
jgi:hypothetical protein